MSIKEQRRKAFEVWASGEFYAGATPVRSTCGQHYRDNDVDEAWNAWNAALDSVVIDLPESFSSGDARDPCIEVPDIIEAIEAAGLKVAP